jgi:hypothetical protein
MISCVAVDVLTYQSVVVMLFVSLSPKTKKHDRVGHKNSGFGFHSGVDGFHQFSIPKTIVFPPDDQEALT